MIYGSAGGLDAGATAAVLITQNTPNVVGSAEENDRFGSALAAGDVTGDGRSDLAIGVPGENGPAIYPSQVIAGGAGAVSFLRGSSTGLTGSQSQIWSQDSPGVDGVAQSTDQFGAALVMAPLDNGNLMDVAIGAPEDSISSIENAGSVTILLGRSTGLSTSGAAAAAGIS